MASSPYGLAYGIGSATSNMMGAYMQGQQYGIQRDMAQQKMDIERQHAATQQQLGQAQIAHYGMQNKAIDEETRQKVLNYTKRRIGDALSTGDFNSAAEMGAALGFHVDPSEMAFIGEDGQKAPDFAKSNGVGFRTHDGQTMFLSKPIIDEWRNGDKYALGMGVQGLKNQGSANRDDANIEREHIRAAAKRDIAGRYGAQAATAFERNVLFTSSRLQKLYGLDAVTAEKMAIDQHRPGGAAERLYGMKAKHRAEADELKAYEYDPEAMVNDELPPEKQAPKVLRKRELERRRSERADGAEATPGFKPEIDAHTGAVTNLRKPPADVLSDAKKALSKLSRAEVITRLKKAGYSAEGL